MEKDQFAKTVAKSTASTRKFGSPFVFTPKYKDLLTKVSAKPGCILKDIKVYRHPDYPMACGVEIEFFDCEPLITGNRTRLEDLCDKPTLIKYGMMNNKP